MRGGESRGERSSTFRFNFTAVTVSLSWYGRRWKPGGRRTEEEDDDVAGREIRESTQGTHASAIDEPRMGRTGGDMESWSWTPAELLPSRAYQENLDTIIRRRWI